MYHSFFIRSLVDRHLGCFHVLAVVNSAAVNTGVHVSFSIMFFLGYMPSSGIVSVTVSPGLPFILGSWFLILQHLSVNSLRKGLTCKGYCETILVYCSC